MNLFATKQIVNQNRANNDVAERLSNTLADCDDRTGWLKIMSICKYLTLSQVILNDGVQDSAPRGGEESCGIARNISARHKDSLLALARFLPIPFNMGPSITCAEALVEILNLCEQTLTALGRHEEGSLSATPADKYCRTRHHKNTNIVRQFVLIQGGLASESR